ncbi:syndetin-like protein isoform X1, partial [Tanacetum coccineum]
VVDAYALTGDVSGLAEKIQSFFLQEVIYETHNVLKTKLILKLLKLKNTRLTYNDLCSRVPESKLRECLLATLVVIFNLMYSYHAIMNFNFDHKIAKLSSLRASKYHGRRDQKFILGPGVIKE